MKTITSRNTKFAGLKSVLLIAAALMASVTAPVWAGGDRNKHGDKAEVVRPNECYHGRTYAEWSAEALKWSLELPLDGHPALDVSPNFDVSAGQSGNVWFLGAPFGTVERTSTIPRNKALFITLANAEASSLEPPESGFHGDTEAEQRAVAKFWADHIVNVFCIIDGEPVKRIERYRVSSPQYEFTAPSPWLFGDIGGEGTSVGDGYYVLIEPLSKGKHTIHFGGTFHFTLAEDGFDGDLPIDITYQLTVK